MDVRVWRRDDRFTRFAEHPGAAGQLEGQLTVSWNANNRRQRRTERRSTGVIENAGMEKTGAITYGKPSKQKTLRSGFSTAN